MNEILKIKISNYGVLIRGNSLLETARVAHWVLRTFCDLSLTILIHNFFHLDLFRGFDR